MIDKVISSVPLPTAAKRAATEDARRRLELRWAAAAGRYLALGGGEDRCPSPSRFSMPSPASRMRGDEDDQFGSFLLPDEVTLPEEAVLGARRRATPTERSAPGRKETP